MSAQNRLLRDHNLSHLAELAIGDAIFRCRFSRDCATSKCRAACCKTGVWVDLSERAQILEHADLIQIHMDPRQVRNPDHWFAVEIVEDMDFPSGRAAGTQVQHGACVFLNSAGRCVLQIASQGQAFNLKPFFCAAFPIYIDHGKLDFDDGCSAGCCMPEAEGELDVFDVCGEELKHVLGERGLVELRHIANDVERGAAGLPSPSTSITENVTRVIVGS